MVTNELLDLLEAEFSTADMLVRDQLIRSLDRRIEEMEEKVRRGKKLDLANLALHRLLASDTLLTAYQNQGDPRGLAVLNQWFNACSRVASWVQEQRQVDSKGILELNGLILGRASGIRNHSVRNGKGAYLSAEDIVFCMERLESRLQAMSSTASAEHPVSKAAVLYQWLNSIHPFEDGNGRTARLAADWMLGLHGYPPVSYTDRVSSYIAIQENQRAFTPLDAIRRICQGTLHSCEELAR